VLRISKRPEPVNLVHCSSCNQHEPFCYSCRHRPTPKNTLRGNPRCAVGPKTPTKGARLYATVIKCLGLSGHRKTHVHPTETAPTELGVARGRSCAFGFVPAPGKVHPGFG
jgi:hypothetical protein